MPQAGVYLLSEGERYLYVGRSDSMPKRLRNHSRGTHRQAAFAFKLAREATGFTNPTYQQAGSRDDLMTRWRSSLHSSRPPFGSVICRSSMWKKQMPYSSACLRLTFQSSWVRRRTAGIPPNRRTSRCTRRRPHHGFSEVNASPAAAAAERGRSGGACRSDRPKHSSER
jgi:predicted GIY-YIG superfamily endonuclease